MTGYAAPPTKIAGDVLTSALWNTYIRDLADSGFMRMLADTTVTGSVAANIDFQSIPATFAHLMLVLYARGDTAATSTGVNLRLNNDTAANYSCINADTVGTGLTAAEALAATSMVNVGLIPANTAPANDFGEMILDIAHYAGATNRKHALARSGARLNTTAATLYHRHSSGIWFAAAAAINRITVLPAAGNFAIGTRATLYGLPA